MNISKSYSSVGNSAKIVNFITNEIPRDFSLFSPPLNKIQMTPKGHEVN